MSTDEKERKKIRLVPGNLRLMQKTSMAIFRLTHWDLVYRNQEIPEEGIHLVITMKRKLTTEMMTTYLPTTLLLLIAYSTTFFKPCFFEAALSVNLTTMLVMTTIFISKMESLPPTSETKMIDMWLILCQLVPFIEVILVTAVEYYREDPQPKRKEETNTHDDTMSLVLMEMYSGKKQQNSPKKKKNAVDTSDSKKKARRNKIQIPFANLRRLTCVPYLHTIGE